MRILIVCQYFWPENFRVNDLALYLSQKGHEITILTGLPNYPSGKIFPDFKQKKEAFYKFNDINIVRVPLIPRRNSNIYYLTLNYVSFLITSCTLGPWKLRGKLFDVVFVNQLSPVTMALPGILIAKIKKIPLALWVLDLWPENLRATGVNSKLILIFFESLVSFIYNRSDIIFAQSKSFIPIIKNNLKKRIRVDFMPSWAEKIFGSNVHNNSVIIPQKKGFDIMFAGNIGEAQDFPCILATAEKLKNYKSIRWIIIGEGRMKHWLENQIQERRLTEQFLILGNFPLEQMPSFYKKADAMLVTLQNNVSYNMTIPGKFQSYLAAGKPIIAALNGETAQLIKKHKIGYVCKSGNANELANLIIKLKLLSRKEKEVMSQNSKILYENMFNRNLILDKLNEKLINLISK